VKPIPNHTRIPSGRWVALALLGCAVTACLSLDYTPLEKRPFYDAARSELESLRIPDPAYGPLSAGAAKRDITPPDGFPLAGYGGRRSSGVHDPVSARALVLSSGGTEIVILSAEVLAITDDLTRAVRERIRSELSIPPENVILTATHTHSGPGALAMRWWEKLAAGSFDRDYFDRTVGRMADAVAEARGRLARAEVTAYRLEAPDRIRNRIVRDGPSDPEIQVLVFRSAGGSQTAYLVNFSAHPTVLRSKNRLLSGDFPGFLVRALEKNPGTVALYTAGSVADQTAVPPRLKGPFKRAEKMGADLADRIMRAAPGGAGRDSVRLSSTRIPLPLPATQPKIGASHRLPAWLGNRFFDRNSELQIIRIDHTVLIGVPADLGSEIGLSWKKTARENGNDAMILGFANDYIGYVMPSVYYDKPVHEAAMSFNGPYMADYLTKFAKPFLIHNVTESRAP
jgi:hypothetical protein